jgi:hypothetical protein
LARPAPGGQRRPFSGGDDGGLTVVLTHWAAVEADFTREYGIDLADPAVLFGMSWRRFSTLLTGLSPKALFRVVADDDLRTINDPEAAERAVAAALG